MKEENSQNENWDKTTQIAGLLWKFTQNEKLTKMNCIDLCKELSCSRSTLFRWRAALKKERHINVLIPRKRGRKPLSRFLSQAHEVVIENCIKEHYLTRSELSFSALQQRVLVELQKRGLDPVDRSSIQTRIDEIEPRKLCKKRQGTCVAQERFDIVRGHLIAQRPLQIVQIDHTKMDVFVIDWITKRVLGRPYMTTCLDVATASLLSVRISFDTLSAASLAKSFAAAVMPRVSSNDLHACGLPKVVHTDNGADLASLAFTTGLAKYGINHEKRPIAQPKYGGHIERLFRTLNTYIHTLPGTTKSNVQELGNVDPRKSAKLTLQQLEQGVLSYVNNVYHRSHHSRLHDTPLNCWNKYWSRSGISPTLPRNKEQFRLDFLPFEIRRITDHGIQLHHLKYSSKQLQKLRNCGVKTLKIHVDPDDIRVIYGCDDKSGVFQIPCQKQFHQRISLGEWQRIRKPVLTNAQRWSDANLIRHYQVHDQIIHDAHQYKSSPNKRSGSRTTAGSRRSLTSLTPSGFGLLIHPGGDNE
ncbi:Mu transposase C-terminal domain-containing protein [Roseovarius sp. EL26]|uniref:Mu transposase C-terminal domain-containing protein n=1 Tax=Roseovarius sp. EL26 TaxID=2126672 RepID=UPI0013C433A5|nr:Mu transposase C-terminal domain-containing protein [Roseovarius sp. EL26]